MTPKPRMRMRGFGVISNPTGGPRYFRASW